MLHTAFCHAKPALLGAEKLRSANLYRPACSLGYGVIAELWAVPPINCLRRVTLRQIVCRAWSALVVPLSSTKSSRPVVFISLYCDVIS
jgi:hypothetical protein